MPRLKTRKGLWLLALLALRRDRDVDRNWLGGTLWPDTDETISLNYLRQSLTDLRKALGPATVRLESSAFRTLRLDLEGADCDVARFDELITRGTPEALEEATALHSGPLLEGCSEEGGF
jgi:DNA-binding transcriptional activator of the SARP family